MLKKRLWMAMSAYVALAVLAATTLERIPRTVVWLVLGAFAAKTWIAYLRERQQ